MTAPPAIDPLVETFLKAATEAALEALDHDGDMPAPAADAINAIVARLCAVLAAAREVCSVSTETGFDDGAGRGAPEPECVAALRAALAAADGSVPPPPRDLSLWRAGCQAGFDVAADAAGRELTESTFWRSQVVATLKAVMDDGPDGDA